MLFTLIPISVYRSLRSARLSTRRGYSRASQIGRSVGPMSRRTWRSRQVEIYAIARYQLITLIFSSRHVAVPRYGGIAIVPFCAVFVSSSRAHVQRSRSNAVFLPSPSSPFLVLRFGVSCARSIVDLREYTYNRAESRQECRNSASSKF